MIPQLLVIIHEISANLVLSFTTVAAQPSQDLFLPSFSAHIRTETTQV
jgi:hypothetical protein